MKNYRLYRWNTITKQWIPAETFDTPEEAQASAESQRDRAMYRSGTKWRVYHMPSFTVKAEVE